jgi:hypothetical protein
MAPADRIVYLIRLRESLAEVQRAVSAALEEVTSVTASEDRTAAAQALGVSAAMLERLVIDPAAPNVPLLRAGLNKALLRPNLPVDAICDAREALEIDDSSDEAIGRTATLLIRVAEEAPLGGPVWADAQPGDRAVFAQAVEYSRTLLDV